MSEPARSKTLQPSPRDELVLTQSEVETIPVDSEEIDLDRASRAATQWLIWMNRRFIFQTMVVAILVSAAAAFLIPSRYQSTAKLMPPDQGSSGMGLSMLAAASSMAGASSNLGSNLGSMAGDLLGMKNSSDLFIGILQSRTVQDDLIDKFNLRKEYWDRRMEDARKDLTRRTTLSADRKSGIIEIDVVDGDPARAEAMAAEYVSKLNQVVIALNTTAAHRERVFLEDRLTHVQQDLETSEKDFSNFATKNNALDVPTQGRAMIEGGAALEGQLIAAQTELEGLKQIFADSNVRVRSVQARIEELQRQLANNVEGQPAGSAAGTAKGSGQGPLFPSLRQLPALGVTYADLYRSAKVQEAVFETLTKEYELAKVEEAKETPSVKVLDSPNKPEQRSFPPRALIIAGGAVLGVVGAIVWICGKRNWDQTAQDDPQKALAQEIIVTVRRSLPWMTTNGSGPGAMNGGGLGPVGRSKGHSDLDS